MGSNFLCRMKSCTTLYSNRFTIWVCLQWKFRKDFQHSINHFIGKKKAKTEQTFQTVRKQQKPIFFRKIWKRVWVERILRPWNRFWKLLNIQHGSNRSKLFDKQSNNCGQSHNLYFTPLFLCHIFRKRARREKMFTREKEIATKLFSLPIRF